VNKQVNKSSINNQKNDKNLMNEDLKQWLTEEVTENPSKTIKTRLKDKKPKGMCQVCGMKTAKAVCLKCGNSVCNSCYFKILGICEKCIPKDKVEEWKKRKTDWERVLGVDWVD